MPWPDRTFVLGILVTITLFYWLVREKLAVVRIHQNKYSANYHLKISFDFVYWTNKRPFPFFLDISIICYFLFACDAKKEWAKQDSEEGTGWNKASTVFKSDLKTILKSARPFQSVRLSLPPVRSHLLGPQSQPLVVQGIFRKNENHIFHRMNITTICIATRSASSKIWYTKSIKSDFY